MKKIEFKFGLYSQSAGSSRNKKLKESNNFDELFKIGLKVKSTDSKGERDYFILEYGVRAIKVDHQIVL